MSYRSLKRVLGETSLERKCRFLFGACLLLLITTSFWLYSFQTERIVNDQNGNTGGLLVDQEMAVRHWKVFEEPQHEEDLAKELADLFGTRKYNVRFILPNRPVMKNGGADGLSPKDDFELDAIRRFMKNAPRKPAVGAPENSKKTDPRKPVVGATENSQKTDPRKPAVGATEDYKERTSEDGDIYHYYQPIRANSDYCLRCHLPMSSATGETSANFGRSVLANSSAEAVGDLMAVADLTFSTEKTRNDIVVNRMILVAMAIITVFLAMVASYAIVRYVIVKPLRHLRDVSDAISRGNVALRADIHTGDEFEELAVAFNRMLRHLTDVQEEIRQVNANLDGKVDELAQANMRLYELNMLKSDFLATMSHELRTPLNSILGFSEVLGSIDALDDKQKRYVQNIQKSGKTLLEMINDILDLAKIESGKMETRPTDFRIAQVVTAQADMARPLTERKNIDLDTHLDGDPPPMHQDQARVQQILNNLLSNAIKFTPEGGRITISARRDEADFLLLAVSDTGVGIAEEDQQAIFEKFRQGKTAMPSGDAMTREYSGSGLGLSIVKELCKLLGGEVSVHSELGKGSTFTVRLPWVLQDQPRLDSALVEEIEEFSKQRFEVGRERSGVSD
jgi:signal transduction histidine kinase